MLQINVQKEYLQSCPCHPMKLKDFKYMTNPDAQGRLKLQIIFVWVTKHKILLGLKMDMH